MGAQGSENQDERVIAGLAHASIALGLVVTSIGGIVAALIIWLTRKDKSSYAAKQALQALVYQVGTFLLSLIAWCCWGVAWFAMFLPPLLRYPDKYVVMPPAGLWVGLILIVIPLGFWGLTVLYGLWGALSCLGGHDFKYMAIGKWLENREL